MTSDFRILDFMLNEIPHECSKCILHQYTASGPYYKILFKSSMTMLEHVFT